MLQIRGAYRTQVVHILALGVVLASIHSASEAAVTVIVDRSDTAGVAGDPIAAGFRGQWANNTPQALLFPLKLTDVAGPAYWPSLDGLWGKADSTGATIHVLLTHTIPAVSGILDQGDSVDYRKKYGAIPGPDSLETVLLPQWRSHVRDWVAVAESLRHVGNDSVPVVYEIWNEPDTRGEWHPHESFGDPVTLFLRVWDTAYEAIRDTLGEAAVIAGPSFAFNVKGAGPGDDNPSGVRMDRFLAHCDTAGTLPDILGWHDIGNSDYADTNLYTTDYENDLKWNLFAQVLYARELVEGLQDTAHRPTQFEINEAMDRGPHVTPGVMVREFALAERARSLGLRLMGRALWCEPCQAETTADCTATSSGGNIETLTSRTHLCGLVWPCCEPDSLLDPVRVQCQEDLLWNKRYAWWAQKAHADLEGRFLNISPGSSLDGLAALNDPGDTLRVLIGNFSGSSQEDVRIVLKNVTSPLVVNGAVHVLVTRMLGDETSRWEAFPGLTPDTLVAQRYVVDGDSTEIHIAGSDCGPGDALSIVVSRITPAVTYAPGNYDDNEAAIWDTEPGNTVIITRQSLGAAWREDNILLKNGVRVIAVDSLGVAIRGDGDSVIVFPENANSFTTLEGLEIQAGDSTEVLVEIGGRGSIRNCTLKDMGEELATKGIVALSGHRGEITDCTIDMTSQAHVPGQTVMGIDLGGLYGVNNTRVSKCEINAKNGFSNSVGISTSIYANALIESTFVQAEKHGIEMLGTSVARYCTVDSTYWEGILTSSGCEVRNCIVTNVLHDNVRGIGCLDVEYSIAPDGFSPTVSPTNSTEDPLYCGPGEYTLRFDSYGSSANNESGNQIGAFPVACAWGELARDVALADTDLTIQGDLTVPSGRKLILTDTPLTAASTDFLEAGEDTATVEIFVSGTLEPTGTSTPLEIGSETGVRGSWDGILASQGSKVFLRNVTLKDGKVGLGDDVTLTADTIRVDGCTFENFQTAGVYLTPSGLSGLDAAPISIDSSEVRMAHAPYGIYLKISDNPMNAFYNVAVTNTEVVNDTVLGTPGTGAPEGVYGIYLYGNGLGSNEDARVQNCEVTGVKFGTGIFVQDFSPILERNLIDRCQTGIELLGTGSPIVRSNRTSGLGVLRCSYGIAVREEATPAVDSVYVGGPDDASGYGIHTDDSAVGTYSHLLVNMDWTQGEAARTAIAFQAFSDGLPVLRTSKLEAFTRGVYLAGTGQIDLGKNGGDRGNNDIHNAGALSYVTSKYCLHDPPDVLAKYNYWGTDPPPSSMFCSWVNYANWLTSSPLSGDLADLGFEIAALAPAFRVGPNPVRGPVTLRLEGMPVGTECRVRVYDLEGRRVKEWTRTVEPLRTEIIWGGEDETGAATPAGVYFVRASVGGREYTVKLVRLAP